MSLLKQNRTNRIRLIKKTLKWKRIRLGLISDAPEKKLKSGEAVELRRLAKVNTWGRRVANIEKVDALHGQKEQVATAAFLAPRGAVADLRPGDPACSVHLAINEVCLSVQWIVDFAPVHQNFKMLRSWA